MPRICSRQDLQTNYFTYEKVNRKKGLPYFVNYLSYFIDALY